MNRVLLFALFILISVTVRAQDGTGRLSIQYYSPQAKPEVLEQWRKDLFEIHEVWVLEDKQTFFEYLREAGLNSEQRAELESIFFKRLAQEQMGRVLSFYSLENAEGFIVMNPDLKNRLSPAVLKAAYTYILHTGRARPFARFNNRIEAVKYFGRFGMYGQELEAVLNKLVDINDVHYFFFNRDTWAKLSGLLRDELINSFMREHEVRKGLQVDLHISVEDDLSKIAEVYAGERDPKQIELYLRDLLRRSQSGKVTVPLADIMHPFIRKHLNTYPACNGPNCFNTGPNVNKGNEYQQKYVGSEMELMDEVFKNYRFVDATESMKAGDLLVYRGPRGDVVHVSTYVVSDIVFTKNGLPKFNPYLFQTRSQNEAIYFPDGKYKLYVFRKPKAGEAVVSEGGLSAFRGRTVYYRDSITPRGKVNKCADLFYN